MSNDRPKRLRDPNDWRVGDPVTEGPDWEDEFGACHCCGKPMTWDEYWARENDPTSPYRRSGIQRPVVQRVRRKRGNVVAIALEQGKWFHIGPRAKRYIMNPSCKSGGYRTTNDPDPKYAI